MFLYITIYDNLLHISGDAKQVNFYIYILYLSLAFILKLGIS